MKTASTLIQILALGACFAIQVAAQGEFRMPGVRRAMQTMAGTNPTLPSMGILQAVLKSIHLDNKLGTIG